VYLDFHKAFKTVPHKHLLSKLRGYGIQGNLLSWIEAFLTRRKQRVVLNGYCSTWAEVVTGVPQGSVRGALLFNIYVNDIPDVVNSPILLFTDDIKIFRCIKTHQDYIQLQSDLNRLSEWSSMWKLKFNISKCNVLHLRFSHQQYIYYLSVLPFNQYYQWGILVSQLIMILNFMNIVTNKANCLLGLIKRSFACLDSDMLVRLYKSMVRPILEYANVIWGPYYLMNQRKVEAIQCRATKLITNLCESDYSTRLTELQLPSLNYCIDVNVVIWYTYLYQIFNNLVDINIGDLYTLSLSTTRCHEFKLYKHHSSCLPRRNFFSYRVLNSWNNLPPHIVESSSLNNFKAKLDAHWTDNMCIFV